MIGPNESHPPDRKFPVQTLTDAKALAARANPFPSRILEALAVDGPSTASALAQRTGQAVGSASHHLKVLAEAGLVVEAPALARDRPARGGGGRRRLPAPDLAETQPGRTAPAL